MWNLLKKNNRECGKLLDLLEETAAARPGVLSVTELSEGWPAAQSNHLAGCGNCRDAAEDLLATREIFRGFGSAAEMARPWFAARVMAAIVAREREFSEVASTWMAVPKFASRLAMASGALLLLGSTWFYERPFPTPNQQASTLAAQESLFEAPQPINQDDVLVNTQENNP